ncbi:MAG TPA: glycerol kinase [Acidimicrobiales bacterium]|nr:glycerol kinase [Acidimicrobiales bacterium]
MAMVIAVDAGTTGVRSLAVDAAGRVTDVAYRELTQHYPRPGWVEHDAAEIWDGVRATLAELAGRLTEAVAAIGITNQRETVVAWDRRSGRPLHRAVVWQDRRTADRCAELREDGHLPLVRQRTGLVLDPYFSATKMEWLLGPGGVERTPDLALGTVDAWVLWNLTGGPDGGVFATDPSNASRTMLFDIGARRWDPELSELFGVPTGALPQVVPCSGRAGVTAGGVAGDLPAGVPVSGLAGDQQAALFGQACFEPGMTKNTYGTGSFVLMNVGPEVPPPVDGLLVSVAWDLGDRGHAYALEGAIFVTGAAIQWLRDGLGIIGEAADTGPLASEVSDTEGVFFVPALAGLGSPWWDPEGRGVITGITRGTGRAHLARAVVEAMAFQTRDVVDSMKGAAGRPVRSLRADGGASVMDLLLQVQADQLQVPVARSANTETTAVGAAWLAGLAEGVWSSLDELAALWRSDAEFTPAITPGGADTRHAAWLRAVERSRRWAG